MHLTICNAELHIHTFALCMTTITKKHKHTERSICASKGGDEKVEACNSLAGVHLQHDILFCLHCVQWAIADMLMPACMSYVCIE